MKHIVTKSRDRHTNFADKHLTKVHRLYDDFQPGAPLQVKEYLIFTMKRGRCCLLRWVKEMDMDMDTVTYALTQLDNHGNELTTRVLTLDHIPHIRQGGVFAPNQAVAVEPNCTAIRVQVLTMTSWSFTYHYDRPDSDQPIVDYHLDETWTPDAAAINRANVNDFVPQRVRSKRGGRTRFVWVMVAVSAVLLIGMILKPYVDYLLPPEEVQAFLKSLLL